MKSYLKLLLLGVISLDQVQAVEQDDLNFFNPKHIHF